MESEKQLYSRRRLFSRRILWGLVLLYFVVGACGERRDTKVFRIARDRTWHNLDLRGKERNMLAFTNELLVAIARDGGFRIELVPAQRGAVVEGLVRRQYDGALSILTPTVSLRRRYEFSEPIFLTGPVLVLRESSSFKEITEMEGRILGLPKDSPLLLRAKDYPHLRIKTYQNMIQALEELVDNNIDGVIMDFFPAYSYTQGLFAGRLKVALLPKNMEGIRLVVLKEDPASLSLVTWFNEGLEQVKEDGTYEQLIEKWGFVQPDKLKFVQ